MNFKMNRRNFLAGSLAAGAGLALPNIIVRTAYGQDDAVAPSNRITLGCIGVGGMGTDNMKNFLKLAGCQWWRYATPTRTGGSGRRTLWTPNTATRTAPCMAISASAGTERYRCGDDRRAGPLACPDCHGGGQCGQGYVLRETAWRIRGAVGPLLTRYGKTTVFSDRNTGSVPGTVPARLYPARNGYVGKIHTVEVATEGPHYQPKYKGALDPQPVPEGFDWEMWRGPAPTEPYNPGRVEWPDWYLIFDYCTGFISNWGVHHLDVANWGCPWIGTESFDLECKETFRKEGFTNNSETWDATFTYADGRKMIFKDKEQMKSGCKFIGDEGWVHVDRSGIWAEPESLLTVEFKDTDTRLTDSTNHGGNLIECVRTRKDPVSDVNAAHTASCLGMLADIAGRLGTKLKWDPKTERFLDNDEANAMLHRDMHNGWSL